MKATIVSLLPVEFDERKPGIYPGTCHIPAAKTGDFEIGVIGDGNCPVYLDESRGSLSVMQTAETLAKSFVNDYINACLAVDWEGKIYPGLFWVAGEQTKATIKSGFKPQLEDAKQAQDRWFLALIRMADDDWNKNRSNRVITNLQRFAAEAMKDVVGNREWNSALVVENYKACKFCTSRIPSAALVCPVCSRQQVSDEEMKKVLA